MDILATSLSKPFLALRGLTMDNERMLSRLKLMSVELVNKFIHDNNLQRFELYRKMNISWGNLWVVLGGIFKGNPHSAMSAIGKCLRNSLLELNNKLNTKYRKNSSLIWKKGKSESVHRI